MIKRLLAAALSLQALLFAAMPLHAQGYPGRPVTMIVPYAAGGPTDITARRLAEGLSILLKQSFVVENRPGASTMIAAQFVARAPKDGYTLLFAPSTTFTVNPHLYQRIAYSIGEFTPISSVSQQTFTITLSKSFAPKNLTELIAYAKANPGKVNFGTTGNGSFTHIIGAMLASAFQVQMAPVHYRGTAQSVSDLLAGRLEMQIEGVSSAIPYLQAGNTNVVAVMSEQRSPAMPNVPTMRELGYPTLEVATTFGLHAPAGTPKEVIALLGNKTREVVQSTEFVRSLAEVGEIATASTPDQFLEQLKRDADRMGAIIRPLNIVLD